MLFILKKRIEKKRSSMLNLAKIHGLDSPIVIEESKKLDKMIIKFQEKYNGIINKKG